MPWPVDPQGPLARSIADLYWLMFGAAVIVLAIVVGALVVAGIRFRERPGHQARQYHGNNVLELIWTVVPTLMVISFSVLSFQRLALVNDVDSGAAMTVQAEGKQWVWNFQYPSDPKFKLSDGTYLKAAEELHIPAGQKVKIELSSVDVIHAFYLPSLGGQKDAVPGRATAMWIQADRPGTYNGQCAEFCGTGHADMLITVVAQNPADYAAWQAAAVKQANLFNDPAVAQGKQLFTSLACAGCHTVQGLTGGKVGPELTHIMSQKTPIGGVAGLDVNEANLIKWVSNAPSNKPGTLMPVFSNKAGGPLDDATILAIVKFLETLK
ncbi:MAG TPA: cytochrome c oxidase subunit II [Chloroflexi bacterium]|jgi:cytochrome c oxidase subunit 2|nr:cytochrome c oxidase subunit II [Chloroflexota bacterium]HAL28465.1 cytochrome c oxidase subunit II [Chloroflexota bacterium]